MSTAQDNAAAAQQALYPPPPPFYNLYREDADGTAERPLPPTPPAPVSGDYQSFGEIHTVGTCFDVRLSVIAPPVLQVSDLQIEPGNPPLQGESLFETRADGSISEPESRSVARPIWSA